MAFNNSYGAKEQNKSLENLGIQEEGAAASLADIDPSFVSSIANDPNKLAMYVNAVAYGGYKLGDIINDMKRAEMASRGDPNASKIKIIDPEMKKDDYMKTADGIQSHTDTIKYIPVSQKIGNFNPEILKYGINMPDEAFKMITPILDQNSQAFKDAVNNVKAAYADLSMQQLQATTEQDKAVADNNLAKFKQNIERQYGFSLSNNATTAWKQIENIGETYGQRMLSGSGMQTNETDNYLKSVRAQDNYTRQSMLSQEDQQTASTYKSSATPQQIQALIAEDQAKGLSKDQWRATKWGLIPSDDVLQKYDMNALKQKYPNETEEHLKAMRDSVLDENGNYRSTVYSNYYSGLNKGTQEKETAAKTQVLQNSSNENEREQGIFSKADPFSSNTDKDKANMEKLQIKTGQTPTPQNTDTPIKTPQPVNVNSNSGTSNPMISSSIASNLAKAMGANPDQMNKLNTSMGSSNDLTKAGAVASNIGSGTTGMTPSKQYSTLSDYYSANGGANTWNSAKRQADAKTAGISNYTGTTDQNSTLLKKLRGY